MKAKIIFAALILSFGIGMLLNSCKKDATSTTDDMTSVAQDETKVDNYFDDASSQTDLYENGTKSLELSSPCTPTVTITKPDGTAFPKHIVIDYGTTGCEGTFGNIRKGKIIVDQTGLMGISGSVRTITFDNFYINDYKIEGTRTVTSNGLNTNQNYQRTVAMVNGQITTPDGKIITRNAEHVEEWIAGADTPLNFTDDKWSVTGSATGTNRNGKSYTAVITSPLIFDFGCQYKITQGIKTITTENHVVVIDFGNGACDNDITKTVDGVVKN
jgi:hypothetical protein